MARPPRGPSPERWPAGEGGAHGAQRPRLPAMQGGRAPRVGTRGLHREREGLGSAGKRQEPQLETGAAWGRAELHTQPGFLSDSETPVLRESLLGFLPRPGAAGKAARRGRGLGLCSAGAPRSGLGA